MGIAIRMAVTVTSPELTGLLVWWGLMLAAPALLLGRWRRRHRRGASRGGIWRTGARGGRADTSPSAPDGAGLARSRESRPDRPGSLTRTTRPDRPPPRPR